MKSSHWRGAPAGHLDLFVPEWQGFGVNNATYDGAMKLRQDLFAQLPFCEVSIEPDQALETRDQILGLDAVCRNQRAIQQALHRHHPQTTFLLGGTCGIEIGPVTYLNHTLSGDLAVIWFDAHGDLNRPDSSPSGHFHGMPLRLMLGEGHHDILSHVDSMLKSNQLFLIGSRDLDLAETEFIESNDIRIFSPSAEINSICQSIQNAGFHNVYLHFDLDVLDPKEFDQTIFQVNDGMTKQRALDCVARLCDSFTVAGSSLLEFVSKPDRNDSEFLCELARRLRNV